jgi:Tfp pilus assembly protein PilP
MKKIISLFSLLIVLSSCNNSPKNADRVLSQSEKTSVAKIKVLDIEEARVALAINCYSCHNPNSSSHDKMLAPPLAGIKFKYKNAYPDKELFVNQMSDFVFNPTEDNAMMKGPVKRFGLMPKTTLSKDKIKEIVLFIYNNDLDVPDWFSEHFEEKHDEKWAENNSN